MNQETHANWIVTGSILAIIGFFLPWATLTIPGIRTISVNGPAWQMPTVWAILVTSVIMLLIGFATRYQANGFVAILQKFLHLAGSLGTLYTFFTGMNSGLFTWVARTAVLRNLGYSPLAYYIANGTHMDFGIGFWILIIGLIISGIGVYAKEE